MTFNTAATFSKLQMLTNDDYARMFPSSLTPPSNPNPPSNPTS